MKQKNVALLSFLLLSTIVFCQKHKDKFTEKVYEKTYYVEKTYPLGDITVILTDGVATDREIKFKVKFQNNTSDYLIIDVKNLVLKANGKDYPCSEKPLIINPNESESRVVNFIGSDLRIDKMSLEINGISKVPSNGKKLVADNFKLPVASNDFTTGDCKVVHLMNEKKTDLVLVKFEASNTGKDVLIVTPTRCALKTQRGTEFANMKTKSKSLILLPGQSDKFTVGWEKIPVSEGDCQFTNMEILWRETFTQSTIQPQPTMTIEIEMDRGLTDAKNK